MGLCFTRAFHTTSAKASKPTTGPWLSNSLTGRIEKRVQCSKQKADEIACAMIDKWLAENRLQGG